MTATGITINTTRSIVPAARLKICGMRRRAASGMPLNERHRAPPRRGADGTVPAPVQTAPAAARGTNADTTVAD